MKTTFHIPGRSYPKRRKYDSGVVDLQLAFFLAGLHQDIGVNLIVGAATDRRLLDEQFQAVIAGGTEIDLRFAIFANLLRQEGGSSINWCLKCFNPWRVYSNAKTNGDSGNFLRVNWIRFVVFEYNPVNREQVDLFHRGMSSEPIGVLFNLNNRFPIHFGIIRVFTVKTCIAKSADSNTFINCGHPLIIEVLKVVLSKNWKADSVFMKHFVHGFEIIFFLRILLN
jgi:hypothetical protein